MILMRNKIYWSQDEIVEIYKDNRCLGTILLSSLEVLVGLDKDDIPFGKEIRMEIINEQSEMD